MEASISNNVTPLPTRLNKKHPLIGTIVTLPSPETAEALAICGVEWLFVDMEHSAALDTAAVQRITQAVAQRCYVMVRVPANEASWIQKVLDIGVDGVIVPHINSVESARQAVRLSKANESTALVLQIEDIEAVTVIDDIVAVSGVDAVFAGPYDLFGSMGKLGQLGDQSVQEAIARVRSACKSADIPLGIFAPDATTAQSALYNDARFVAISTDIGLMLKSIKTVLNELNDIQ